MLTPLMEAPPVTTVLPCLAVGWSLDSHRVFVVALARLPVDFQLAELHKLAKIACPCSWTLHAITSVSIVIDSLFGTVCDCIVTCHCPSLRCAHKVEGLLSVALLGSDAHCRVDGGSELGCLAHGGSRARAGVLAIEHTLHLACEIPCLLVGSVGGTMRSEGLLVVGLGLALTIELLLRSSSDRSGEGFGSLLSFTLGFGPGAHSSSVDSLGGSVSARGVEGSALALGEGREGPGLEVDLGAGGLGDFSGGGDEVLVSLGLGLGCGLYVGLAEVHTMLALGHSIYDLLARVDVGLHIFAGFRDELATIFVACSSGSHLVDLLLGFGEVIVDSVMRILRDHGVSDWGRRG